MCHFPWVPDSLSENVPYVSSAGKIVQILCLYFSAAPFIIFLIIFVIIHYVGERLQPVLEPAPYLSLNGTRELLVGSPFGNAVRKAANYCTGNCKEG